MSITDLPSLTHLLVITSSTLPPAKEFILKNLLSSLPDPCASHPCWTLRSGRYHICVQQRKHLARASHPLEGNGATPPNPLYGPAWMHTPISWTTKQISNLDTPRIVRPNIGRCMHCHSRHLWENLTKFPRPFRAWSEDRKIKLTTAELKNTMTSISKNSSINWCKITPIQKVKDEVQLTLLFNWGMHRGRILAPIMKASKRHFLKSGI